MLDKYIDKYIEMLFKAIEKLSWNKKSIIHKYAKNIRRYVKYVFFIAPIFSLVEFRRTVHNFPYITFLIILISLALIYLLDLTYFIIDDKMKDKLIKK